MKKSVTDLKTKETTEVDLTPEEEAQRQVDIQNAATEADKKAAKKVKKNKFLDSLNPNQLEGFEAIMEDGNIN